MSTSTQSETCKFTLKAKVVVITGCTGVLGSAYTRMFAAEGAQLVIADLAEQNPTLRAQQIRDEFGVKCVGVACDVGSEADVRALFQVARVEYGRADVVLNNAAATGEHLMNLGRVFAPFEEYPLVIWDQVLRTNLTGVFLVAREGGRLLVEAGGGSLINVSSIYGIVGPDHRIYQDMPFASFPAYSASKAGVHGLTKWLATYWGEKGVRVNTLVPGGVMNGQDSEFVRRYSNRVPMGRMANPRDLVGMVGFLASDASSYCTGQLFVVDGGLTAW